MEFSAKPLLKTYSDELKRQQAEAANQTTKEIKSGKGSAQTAYKVATIDNDLSALSHQYPLIFFTEQFLSRSLRVLAQARSSLIRFDGSSMFDRNWVCHKTLF